MKSHKKIQIISIGHRCLHQHANLNIKMDAKTKQQRKRYTNIVHKCTINIIEKDISMYIHKEADITTV